MSKKKVNKIEGVDRVKDSKECNNNAWGSDNGYGGGYIDDNICISDTGSGVYFGDEETTVWSSLDLHSIDYKFNEKEIMDEMQSYIDSTYNSHYSESKFQATEFIFDGGHAEGFCIGNIMKYAQRYGKKGSPEESRKDLQKVIHYAIMAIHSHDLKLK
tara:strand:+ start:299 stop:772 length:474 start_codon:yes stop_codon:yes gene_type:complete